MIHASLCHHMDASYWSMQTAQDFDHNCCKLYLHRPSSSEVPKTIRCLGQEAGILASLSPSSWLAALCASEALEIICQRVAVPSALLPMLARKRLPGRQPDSRMPGREALVHIAKGVHRHGCVVWHQELLRCAATVLLSPC